MIDAAGLAELQRRSSAATGGGQRGAWPAANAMDADELVAFLTEDRYGVLATATPQRHRPVARPISFCVHGTTFWFATVAGARLRNLERTPWASLVVSDGGPQRHRAVLPDGPVTIVTDPGTEVVVAWSARDHTEPTWATAWLALAPERLLSYSSERG